jgi:predicted RNA-binding protein associated with RNAse of E/G family
VQLTKPAVFEGLVEGWWYVDLVEIERIDDGLVVHDMYVDLLFPPDLNRYQVLDLEELADALTGGKITAAQCAEALTATQQFVHRYLRGAEEGPVGPSAEFPPPEVVALEQLPSLL